MLIVEKIKHFIAHQFWRRVAYYDGVIQRFSYEKGHLELVPNNESRYFLTIISPQYTFSESTKLPVSTMSEANKLAKNLTINSPFEGHTVHKVKEQEGIFFVNSTVLMQKTYKHSVFLLPVTWLFNVQPQQLYLYHFNDYKVGFATEQTQSKSSLIKTESDLMTFCHHLDFDVAPHQAIEVSTESTLQALKFGITKLSFLTWQTAFQNQINAKSINVNWKSLIFTIALSASFYFIGVSGYLLAKEKWLEHRTSSLKLAVNEVIVQRKEMQGYYNELLDIQTLVSQQSAHLAILPGLLFLIENNAVITNLNYINGSVEIKGLVNQASDLLLALNESNLVNNAAFVRPLRKERDGLENFTIGYSILQEDIDAIQ